MKQNHNEREYLFKTPRLIITDASLSLDSNSGLLSRIVDLLTPPVVKSLPPHFQNISSLDSADLWLKRMITESQCLLVKSSETNVVIGFIFLYEAHDKSAQIGYLLGEDYWGQGYAKEFLNALINWCRELGSVSTLIAGVEQDNTASAHLLRKLGFIECIDKSSSVAFYEYTLRPNDL
ncbi:GNAT family N-acetyltransferase [Photobacterium sp. SDRW27]|uniref:GNAT family N-acetyltransferase n=1 Tax=Photobacterium obscurum TaxID=2829490 RepID=UPI002243176C|nr:GNAT family N-acetyltransferase [Photobacterium obscurum]MCW8330171.1 GNAT family N-acetyltransferase [Photobacterium obscurum]